MCIINFVGRIWPFDAETYLLYKTLGKWPIPALFVLKLNYPSSDVILWYKSPNAYVEAAGGLRVEKDEVKL